MTARRSTTVLAAIVVVLSVVFAALTIADAASVPGVVGPNLLN